MYSLLFLAFISLGLSIALTPLVRIAAHRLGLLDRPDSARKPDYRPIPRVGGIAVALAFVLSYGIWWLTPLQGFATVQSSLPLFWKLSPAIALVFLIGLFDDIVHLNAWWKLVGQTIAASIAYLAGVQVTGFAGTVFTHWWWTFPSTVLWLVACTNAINLIDGIDGLAAGLSLVATLSMLLGAVLSHNVLLAFATVPLAGCLLGFLRYNFNPASVYLGDSGSLFIGLLLGCCGVLSSQKSATILGMTAPIIALAIPLLDTSLTVMRRFLRGQPILTADRGHIHHRLLDRGLTPRGTALLLYGIGAIAAMFSLAMANNNLEIPVVIVFGVATWIGIQRLGFVEFDIAGRLMLQGAFRGLLTSHIALDSLKSRLTTAATTEDCWDILQSSYRELGFCRVQMHFSGLSFSTGSPDPQNCCWRVAIPLRGSDFVELAHHFDCDEYRTGLASLADALRQSLTSRYTTQPRLAGSAGVGG